MSRILIIICFSLPLFAQRADFYDNYDYNMKNYKGGDSVGEDSYKEYDLPPTFKKPALVSPKSVQVQPDLSSLIQGPVGIRKTNNQPQTLTPKTDNLPINPITGTVNPAAIAAQREKEKANKEKKRQFLNRDIEPYFETRERRMEIIFLTTFPFAVALSVGITMLLGNARGNQLLLQPTFIKSTPGFASIVLLACGFSAVNMISDINHYDEYMKNKKVNNLGLLPTDMQNHLYKGQHILDFSLAIGTKNF